MSYRIWFTESARTDLDDFDAHNQRIIIAGIVTHLGADAEKETRRKKRLRQNPLAPWELRVAQFRVFYAIEEANTVKILAVGQKAHNDLFIRGRKIEL